MFRFIRDLRRGYTDADIARARYKVMGLPVIAGRPPFVTLFLTRREWKAFKGEGMSVDDGLADQSVPCHLPRVEIRVIGS
jgi:hypothetical protein